MDPETFDRLVSAIVAAAAAFVVVEARHALPVIRRGRWRLAVALALGMGAAAMATLPGPARQPARAQDPAPTITLTVTITPTATLTPMPTPGYVYLQADGAMRVEACDGLAQVVGTRPPPLVGCVPVDPCDPCPPGGGDVGQGFLLWPGAAWRYRVFQDATPTPAPTAPCEIVYIIVTATPTATPTPTPTPTADWVATAVAGTLTALAPTATGTPRPTDTPPPTLAPEATPTQARYTLMLFPVLQHRPGEGGRR